MGAQHGRGSTEKVSAKAPCEQGDRRECDELAYRSKQRPFVMRVRGRRNSKKSQ